MVAGSNKILCKYQLLFTFFSTFEVANTFLYLPVSFGIYYLIWNMIDFFKKSMEALYVIFKNHIVCEEL